ncbi:MAG: YceI family protein [Phenylobacterium sp.]|uniref:YceI family protein n=1 Tax=Phenylobacterium sp. TaxID=1871053 RepID=UPI001A46D5A9|nr:YceI family protein [Phenylobacterium sp.]MBL8771935.1 YceI family protein [Phenylobacterium sp.]
MRIASLIVALTVGLAAAPALAQSPNASPAAARAVAAGTYNVDPNHTIVTWSVDHMGFSRLSGMVGEMKGVLKLDPARPEAASVEIDIPLSGLRVTSPAFGKHLATGDLFDTAKHPTARFVSRSVKVNGLQAQIAGDLTLRGVTRPVVLDARFYGAGANPMTKAATVGFSAVAKLKRSEFGLGYAVPAVSDEVNLEIDAAFEKAPG